MGGQGSGHPYDRDKRDVVEDYWSLDINWLKREGCLQPGLCSSIHWTREGQPSGSINLTAHEDKVALAYTYASGGTAESVNQTIPLDRTGCHFGGSRPWFFCPKCGQRVGVLCGAGKLFWCRHCYSLAYRSQQSSESDRLLMKAQAIRKRLGASPCTSDPIDSKPTGMHWRTFKRLKHQALIAGHRSNYLLLKRLETCVERLAKCMGIRADTQ
jgi:hypothetical protein